MLTSNPIILETLAVLREHGVKDFVLCPGSRNAAIVHTVCQVEEFRTHRATDERCAGFMALGLALATGRPAVVVVTSGSALANLYPSACEAFYQNVPVIFLSADRPQAWIGQMDGQTMPQEGALGKMVKMSASLPETDIWHANRQVNEAILEAQYKLPSGPVHINIPLSEPIYDFTTDALPQARKIEYRETLLPQQNPGDSEREVPAEDWSNSLLILGQAIPTERLHPSLLRLTRMHITVIGENLCNQEAELYTNAFDIDWSRMKPVERVITIGGHIVNKELKEFFRKNKPREHWHISHDGAVVDLFGCQTVAIKSDYTKALNEIFRDVNRKSHKLELPLKENTDTANKRTALIQELFDNIPPTSLVHLANSSTIRIAQHAKLKEHFNKKSGSSYRPYIFCNRGINGIEGSLSTTVGIAMAAPQYQKVFAVVGDLSFFYDQNAFWASPLPQNLHILVFNDGRGGIFNSLPVPQEPETSRQAIMGEHNLSARHVAMLHNIKYLEGEENLQEFISSEEITILEIKL